MSLHRRQLVQGGLFTLAATAFHGRALAAPEPGAPRALSLLNLHTGERLSAEYWSAAGYLDDSLTAFSHLLRDHRTSEVHPIDPGVFDILAALQGRLDSRDTIQVISGYRSPQTNAALHAKSSGVASGSLHMQGKAIDIRIPGIELARLRDTALGLQRGGVGFYPKDDFVHVDVGRVRRW